jgi:hypothetical protein
MKPVPMCRRRRRTCVTASFRGDPACKALAKDVGKFRAKSGRGRQALDRSSKQCDPLLQFLWGETEVQAICWKSPTCPHLGLNWADGLYCEIRILGFGRLGLCRRSRGGRGVLGYLLRQELMGQN